jgi:hypothetical protein
MRKKAEDYRRRITKAVADKQQLLARQHDREDEPRLESSRPGLCSSIKSPWGCLR